MSMDWEYERQQGVQVLLSFIQLSITKLWDPPIAEEEFVRYCHMSVLGSVFKCVIFAVSSVRCVLQLI